MLHSGRACTQVAYGSQSGTQMQHTLAMHAISTLSPQPHEHTGASQTVIFCLSTCELLPVDLVFMQSKT